MNDSPKPLMTVREVAAQMRLSERLVRAMTRDGRLATVRVGRRVLVRPERLEEFLAKHEDAAHR